MATAPRRARRCGCGAQAARDSHRVTINTSDGWTWNADPIKPTISPSIKVTGVQWGAGSGFRKPTHLAAGGEPIVCHSFVRAGRWEFLADCTHALAGQTVDMVPLPDWLDAELA